MKKLYFTQSLKLYIVGSQGASQLGGSLLGIPPGYKANKLKESLSYPLGIIRTLVWRKENSLYFDRKDQYLHEVS